MSRGAGAGAPAARNRGPGKAGARPVTKKGTLRPGGRKRTY